MLRGEMVLLRPLEKDDYATMAVYGTDLATMVLVDDDPPTPRTQADLEEEIEEYRKKGEAIPFAIEVDGVMVGDCSLHHIDEFSRTCEFGITLAPESRGKGYGRETLSLLIDYAFRYLNFHKVSLTVYSDNDAAIGLYRSLGFTEEGVRRQHIWNDGRYKDWVEMGLLRSEWNA